MEDKQIAIIGIIVIIIVAIIGFVAVTISINGNTNGINMSSIDSAPKGKMVIKVQADDNVTGVLKLVEYSNITKNNNGTYNLSQFGKSYALLGYPVYSYGAEQDIQMIDGKAEYEVSSGTQFIAMYSYITELNKNYGIGQTNNKNYVTVDLYINGVKNNQVNPICIPPKQILIGEVN
ncbi:MAG: hypothetical protein ACRCVG_01245 [Methanobacteriaceae archaeon]